MPFIAYNILKVQPESVTIRPQNSSQAHNPKTPNPKTQPTQSPETNWSGTNRLTPSKITNNKQTAGSKQDHSLAKPYHSETKLKKCQNHH